MYIHSPCMMGNHTTFRFCIMTSRVYDFVIINRCIMISQQALSVIISDIRILNTAIALM